MRILLVEDNKKLSKYVVESLESESYAVDAVYDGEAGERMANINTYDLLVMDIMLPGKDGIAVCQSLREGGSVTPIILVTARDNTEDKILGLDSGADDYLVKPFEMQELLARVRALLRRPTETLKHTLTVQDITMHSNTHEVYQNGVLVNLTVKEYAVLEFMMRHAGSAVTREQILEHCWDFAYDAFSNITDVYIKQLRKKLHDQNTKYIKTVRGVGYTFLE